jgi:hypothetical protein
MFGSSPIPKRPLTRRISRDFKIDVEHRGSSASPWLAVVVAVGLAMARALEGGTCERLIKSVTVIPPTGGGRA